MDLAPLTARSRPRLTGLRTVLDAGVRIGFERTLEQDAALGIRQLVDVACKALSPAVNDPYTVVQAVDHLSVIFCALSTRPLGNHVVQDGSGAAVIVPGRRFPDYLAVICGSSAATAPASPPSPMPCCGCWATAPPWPVTIPSGAQPSKNRHASSSPMPSARLSSRPTLPSRMPRQSRCAKRWLRTSPCQTHPPAGG
jgi:hypothetical protein